jgi:hypothetical protein
MSLAPTASPAGASVYYRYQDAQGRLHIVDSLAGVPGPLRARAERIELAAPSKQPTSSPAGTHWTSFGLGIGAGLLLVLLFLSVRRGSGALLKAGLVIGAALLLGAAYFGWIRRQSGHAESAFASPSALIDDARKAVDQANRRNREQDEALKEIEREAK